LEGDDRLRPRQLALESTVLDFELSHARIDQLGRRSPLARAPGEISLTVVFFVLSVGIAVFPTDGHDADALIKYADIAMYRAKERGRNTYHFFTPALNVKDVIKELIDDEQAPLTDQEIMERLAEHGYHIARRTVAKYRMQLAILPSSLR